MSNPEKPDNCENDNELVECYYCNAVLNGKNLWIVGEHEPITVCEECYARKADPRRRIDA